MPPQNRSRNPFKFFRPPPYPVSLLYVVECILMGVGLLSFLSPIGHRRMGHRMPPFPLQEYFFPWGGLVIILVLALLAWQIPIRRAPWKKGGYTLAGFGLCWLMGLPPRMFMPFAALLLAVVLRACLYLRWPGRALVAMLAFSSFTLRISIHIVVMVNRLESGGRLPPGLRRRGADEFQAILLQFSLGSTLLFGLVLLFVVLMVGTLMTEYQSRQKLALANQRLRRYSMIVEDQATLQERNRIARELHDSIGHCLTAQSIQLENVSVWFEKNYDKAKGHLDIARTLNQEALANVRRSVSQLRQAPIDGAIFPEAVSTLIQDYEKNTKIPVQLTMELAETQSKEIAIALYRVIQESLTNIAKHAKAQQISVTIKESDQSIGLDVVDNGRGFTLSTNQRGFGLTSMRERIEAINGSFRIQTSPGEGCKISVVIPRAGGQV